MTKEELKQEAEEWLCNNLHSASEEDFIKAMIDIAEPREKRIEELIALINAERERQEKCDDVHLRKIAELEKENAELKETVLQFQKDSYCGVCHFKTKTQLNQATEIIKEFVEWANWQGNSKCPSFKSIQDKAEQFLSEVDL